MSWEIIGAVGDFLSGIGVILSLGYVAVQIRRNTLAQRNESRRATMREFTDWYTVNMQRPDIMAVWNMMNSTRSYAGECPEQQCLPGERRSGRNVRDRN